MSSPEVTKLGKLLGESKKAGGDRFTEKEIRQLSIYYGLVLKWNGRLHLTSITQPQTFIERHINEATFAEAHLLRSVTELWDLGTGLGIPGLPIALFQPQLKVKLVESSRNKVIFLEEVISTLGLANTDLLNSRFESLRELPTGSCLTSRAIERMGEMIPQMIRLGINCSQLLIFGTERTESIIRSNLMSGWQLLTHPIPDSERRVLIEAIRFT